MSKNINFNIGLVHFGNQFGLDLEERLNQVAPFEDKNGDKVKIKAEHVEIHEIDLDYETSYDMIIDRGSHRFKQGIGILMTYAFKGIYVINNPLSFHFFIENKDVGYSIAKELGIKVPTTFILPPHTTPSLDGDDFRYHKIFEWDKMMEKVKFPCIIKPAGGRAAIAVNKADNMEELLYHYNESKEMIMTVQSIVESDNEWQIRCICVGRKIVPIKYIFRKMDGSEYIYDTEFLTPEQGKKVIESTRIINRAFGYEMNSVEFIIDKDGEPWAIDFNNPIPDGRASVLGPIFYNDYQDAFVQRAIEIATYKPKYLFLPKLNEYSEIAQMKISKEEKFNLALVEANKYYLDNQI
ncbi:MAG: hypothetical protein H7263_04520 [Candidatus Sericytochromatia bacterium]|nr:hypothetical protein [Candidatus Sericytochromatia bacterium]